MTNAIKFLTNAIQINFSKWPLLFKSIFQDDKWFENWFLKMIHARQIGLKKNYVIQWNSSQRDSRFPLRAGSFPRGDADRKCRCIVCQFFKLSCAEKIRKAMTASSNTAMKNKQISQKQKAAAAISKTEKTSGPIERWHCFAQKWRRSDSPERRRKAGGSFKYLSR